MRTWFVWIGMIGTVLGGWATAWGNESQTLIVSASPVFTNVLTAIAEAFETAHPGMSVIYNFAAAGELVQQLAQGAPVDVFASAHPRFLDDAARRALIAPETRCDFAQDALVLIVNRQARPLIVTVQDLTKAAIERIAIGDVQTVSAGQYAQEALLGYGVWEQIQAKLIIGNTVRQVLDYVRRGEVDAGMVFATDAALAAEHVEVVMTLEHHAPILYALAVTRVTDHPEAARQFVEFVLNPESQAILRQFGFQAATTE
jgi:molybdate transport system substrate-binding protein